MKLLRHSQDPEQLAIAAESFLRSGGVLLLADLEELSLEERKALLVAGEKVWATRLVKIVSAMRSSLGTAEVLAPFDGGIARRVLEVLRAVDELKIDDEVA